MKWFCLLAYLAVLPYSIRTENLIDLLPSCVSACTSHLLDQSTCSITDNECVCADAHLIANINACVAGNCTVKQSLSAVNATATFCNVPVRSKAMFLDIMATTFGALALSIVILRLITRFRPFNAQFRFDDLFIVTATVPMVLLIPTQLIITRAGFGSDIYTVKFSNIEIILKSLYAYSFFYDTAITMTKLSILAFYLRIFTSRNFRVSVYILMGFCTAWLISMLFAAAFQCWPISYAWKSYTGEAKGSCIDLRALAWASTATNISLEIAIITLPISQILALTLSPRKKIQVICMFAVGIFVTIVSIIRLKSLIKVAHTTNFTWDYIDSAYMATLEVNVGVICACMPSMQLLLRRIAPEWFGSTIHSDFRAPPYASISKAQHNTNSHIHPRTTITKSVTRTTSAPPGSAHSDTIELVSRTDKSNRPEGSTTVTSIEVSEDNVSVHITK